MKTVACVKVCGGEINPFDESALECALTLSSDVTVLSMGPESAAEALKPLTRLGVRVILLSDKIFAGSDTLATAYILERAIKKLDADMILCGRQSVDGDTAQVGPMLSQNLGISLIAGTIKIKTDKTDKTNERKMIAETRMGEVRIDTPALVTVERGYFLRFPSIFSREGEVEHWDNSDINCDPNRCGLDGSPTRVLKTFENERGRRSCKFISFDEFLPLIEDLKSRRDDDRREKQRYSGEKLKNVWAVGEKAAEIARPMAEKLTITDELDPREIAAMAEKDMPDAILWNSDFWGRNNAPIAAAILKTGLCADCTSIETDGEILYMYRPARSGNITAKIKCITKPQMATVRTESTSADIIVSGGRGVSDKIDKLYSLADKIGAEVCSSRGLVDMGKMQYERQVGLTGRQVAPKIYIAVGISGAVHHTCAIEDSGTIIAINPDKDARIFDYADYGIVAEF